MVKKYFRYIKDTLSCRFSKHFCLHGSIINWITYNISSNNNNSVVIENSSVFHCSFNINGTNNRIVIKNNADIVYCNFSVFGDNNLIIFDGNKGIVNLINRGNNNVVSIGKDTTMETVYMVSMGKNNSIEIGKGCMFSGDVEIWNTDSHLITDENGTALNPSKPVRIGNRVWVGKHVKILKGVSIGDDTILGMNAVITHDVHANSIAAGNPAKTVKNGVKWHRGFIEI